MLASSWLFIRGPKSVRMVREENPEGVVYLNVNGPEHATAIYVGTPEACAGYQSRLEFRLNASGFALVGGTSDRRKAVPTGLKVPHDRRRKTA